MAQIYPFRAIHYSRELASKIADLATPPYDVISETEKAALARRHAYNMVHLDLPVNTSGDAFYEHSRKQFNEWCRSGVLTQDETASFYLLRETYIESGQRAERIGIFARVKIEKPETNVILPHERTLDKPFQDRLQLLRASQANYSPVFFVYEDERLGVEQLAADVAQDKPLFSYTDDLGIKRALWSISETAKIDQIQQTLSNKTLIIADGHHRYRTAAAYLTENSAADTLLGYLVNSRQKDFIIKPIHRFLRIRSLNPEFSFKEFVARLKNGCQIETDVSLPEDLADLKIPRGTIVCHETDTHQTLAILTARGSTSEAIETVAFERLIAGGALGLSEQQIQKGAISYFHSKEEYREICAQGGLLVFLLPALQFHDILRICRSGGVLPQKSTFFYPKVPTGLVINRL